ncbi:MAG: TldD/PmbA family protein [Coriobacteriales bacterium]|nr:TldD/PmbA family protein [Coriobacteriales bacterium]
MSMTADQARELARRAVEMTAAADEAEALVGAETSALTRFADNRIHQNVATDDSVVSIRAVVGKRVGVASTNRLDDGSLRAAANSAIAIARASAEDPDFPGLPAPEPVEIVDRARQAARSFGPEQRADAVGAIVEASRTRGLVAAGTIRAAEHAIAIASSRGVDVGMTITGAGGTVLSTGEPSGTGWASFIGASPELFEFAAIGAEAADIAVRSKEPGDLDPGEYTVVLAPEAVSDIVNFLAYTGFSAKAIAEDRSFMAGRVGERVMSESITIIDDALDPEAIGLTFDYEGMPKKRAVLIDAGRVGEPITDSYWAARLSMPNSGGALPAPNSFGPLPLDLQMAPGDATIDELIAAVDRGVYVTRFHYTNIEDPKTVTLTGMTRDGTFAIENGKLGRPLKNLRFTQGAIEALARVKGITSARRHVGSEESSTLVPALLIERFAMTGQTG